tara:strand:- start:223 stop:855 length:633 start_codon:yes stop_codon:yes gene_type:complete
MSQTRTQLVGGVGISTVDDLTVFGNLNVTGITTIGTPGAGSSVAFATTAYNLAGTPNITAGVVTATSFHGDGSNLSGIDATSLKDGGGTVRVQANTSGAVVTGVITSTNLVVENSAFTAISTTPINKTIVNREFTSVIGIGTTAGVTVTLPASPQPGWLAGVGIAGTFTDTIVGRNGSNIMGLSEDMTIDVAYLNVSFLYIDGTIGWKVI